MGVIQKKNPKHNHKSYFFVTRRGSGGEGFHKALRPPPGLLFTGVLYILGQSYFMHVQFFSAGNRH